MNEIDKYLSENPTLKYDWVNTKPKIDSLAELGVDVELTPISNKVEYPDSIVLLLNGLKLIRVREYEHHPRYGRLLVRIKKSKAWLTYQGVETVEEVDDYYNQDAEWLDVYI